MTEIVKTGQMSPLPAAAAPAVTLTAGAAAHIRKMVADEGARNVMLRLSVNGGGCAGFSYEFGFAQAVGEDDLVFERDGAKLVVDAVSLALLAGAEVDYVENLMGASFQIKNPQAKTSCGCGTSFSI